MISDFNSELENVWVSIIFFLDQSSQLGFQVLFNTRGHIGTGPQHLSLMGLLPCYPHQGDSW